MKEYRKPWMEIELFDADLITASGDDCPDDFVLCSVELPPQPPT